MTKEKRLKIGGTDAGVVAVIVSVGQGRKKANGSQ